MPAFAPSQPDLLFQALADPYRRSLVERLARGPATVSALAAPTALGLPAVLKQLRILEAGGIVVSAKVGRVRTYRMQPHAFAGISSWIAQREAEMGQSFDRLEALMLELPEEKP